MRHPRSGHAKIELIAFVSSNSSTFVRIELQHAIIFEFEALKRSSALLEFKPIKNDGSHL